MNLALFDCSASFGDGAGTVVNVRYILYKLYRPIITISLYKALFPRSN